MTKLATGHRILTSADLKMGNNNERQGYKRHQKKNSFKKVTI
jgi:hypothetical protein